jgi:hypothetical protein
MASLCGQKNAAILAHSPVADHLLFEARGAAHKDARLRRPRRMAVRQVVHQNVDVARDAVFARMLDFVTSKSKAHNE